MEQLNTNTFNLSIPNNHHERKYMLKLMQKNFSPELSLSAIKAEIAPGAGFIFTANNQFIGSVTIDILDKVTAAFRMLVIDEKLRNQGFGKIMLSLAENIAFKNGCSLVYTRSVLKAVNFYQRAGFIEAINHEFNFVPDTIFMSKKISL